MMKRFPSRRLVGVLLVTTLIATLAIAARDLLTATSDASALAASRTLDPIAEQALTYTQEHVKIISGEPQVVLSRSITIRELQDAGLPVGNYAPDCMRPMHLVILKGDFDLRGTMPASVVEAVRQPASFIGYIYSLKTGNLVGIVGDRSGAMFKQVLGDKALPDSSSLPNPKFGSTAESPYAPPGIAKIHPYVPCEDVVISGNQTPTTP